MRSEARAGDHRARLAYGNGVVVIADADVRYGRAAPFGDGPRHCSVMVKVADVDSQFDQASRRGARTLRTPANYPYGERQYSARDFAGHRWTFTQTIADLASEHWGGTCPAR